MRIFAVCEGSNHSRDTSTYFIDLDKLDRTDPDVKAWAEDIEGNLNCGIAGDWLEDREDEDGELYDKIEEMLESARVDVTFPVEIHGLLEIYPD